MNSETSTITIRHARLSDCPGLARVHVDTWRTTYRGIVLQSYLDQLSYSVRESKWQNILSNPKDGECNFIAQDSDGVIIGFSGGGPERDSSTDYAGELYAVYFLEQFQRRGIGRRLVKAVVDELLLRGWNSMRVWVLAANPACIFYERLGGKVVAQKEITIDDAQLLELAYGWTDISRRWL